MLMPLNADAPSPPVPISFGHPACTEGLERAAEMRYFESRLRSPPAARTPVDYLLAFPRAGARLVEQAVRNAGLHAGPSARNVWAILAQLGEAWGDGRSPISLHVPTIWLEFDDIRRAGASEAAPSVSLCLVPRYSPNQPLATRDPERERRVVRAALEVLDVADPVLISQLDDLFAVPTHALRWIHLSVMLGRSPRAVKLYGWGERAELLPLLCRLGFAGDRRELETLMADLYPRELLGDDVFLDLNLDDYRDRSRCSLGLAAARQHLATAPDRDPFRAALLRRWAQRGLCDTATVESGRAWLAAEHPLGGSDGNSLARRFLDLKLVLRAGCEPLAKSYLGLAGVRRAVARGAPSA